MPQDLLNRILSDLQQLSQEVGDVSNIKEQITRAKADLVSINETKANADRQMREAQTLLSQAQRDAQQRFDQDMFTKQGLLKSLQDRIAALEARHKELVDDVAEKEMRVRAATISMEDMKRKLAS
jgi:hypothetical protein